MNKKNEVYINIKMLLPKTILTLNAQFKAHMAEGKRSCVRF